ncbi:hypothetical protein [Devosia nitrariae]|uniref:Lamin tail domain-containing protein n=1 Tax=Devosia nitrariae TaxID=2071872 RepID=A0ABQ5W227_9HYPH|nr:hypothetical protein [Devosia nitrariae]GLQ53955.1 hypothetical protein GCM10010862_12140 [Devosia nitrariae]
MTNANARSPTTCRRVSDRATLSAGVAVTLWLLVSGAALAQEPAGDAPAATTPGQQEPGDPGVVCSVSGYDVIIRNTGTDPIASGAAVNWSVPFARVEGSHALTAVLDPGGRVFLTGALGSNFLSSSAECVAGMAGEPDQPAGGDNAPAPPAN